MGGFAGIAVFHADVAAYQRPVSDGDEVVAVEVEVEVDPTVVVAAVEVDVVAVEVEVDGTVVDAAVEVEIDAAVSPTTTAVASDVETADPFLFDAVTATRNVRPTSPDDTTYDEPVADPTPPQPDPLESQLNH